MPSEENGIEKIVDWSSAGGVPLRTVGAKPQGSREAAAFASYLSEPPGTLLISCAAWYSTPMS